MAYYWKGNDKMTTLELEQAIEESKKILVDGSPSLFSEYSLCYFFTTESIKSYLTKITFKKDRVLSVLSSGDQIFNLACMGVKNIDAFDLNRLTYFTFYLKRAMILGLNENEFFILHSKNYAFLNNLRKFQGLLSRLQKFMPEEVYLYYIKLIEFQSKRLSRVSGIVNLYKPGSGGYDKKDNFYASGSNYLATQRNLQDLNLNFIFDDARNIPDLVDGNYDLILLSNIVDYLGTKELPIDICDLQIYLEQYQKLLCDYGVIVNYLYGMSDSFIIKHSNITEEQLDSSNLHSVNHLEGYYLVRKKGGKHYERN